MEGIVSSEDVLGGEPRVEGTRISVRQIGELVDLHGNHPEYVANRLGLRKRSVYRAMVYYHEHPDEMVAARKERKEMEAEAVDRAITAPIGNSDTATRSKR